MPNATAVCYVADTDFLFPTLLSIKSLRRFVPADRADVFVFVLDGEATALAAFATHAAALAFTIVPLDLGAELAVEADKWNPTHVPPSSLGRFYIEAALPARITRLLYVDGDTLFVGDPTSLLDLPLAGGRLAAVEDSCFFSRHDRGAYGSGIRTYFRSLGLAHAAGYFNAGVLLADRAGWKAITADALAYFRANVARCRHHDQSALNAVAGDRRVRLSPAWNFQTPFRHWGVQDEVKPKLLHFTQFPKPWMGRAEPWWDVHASLAQLADELAPLRLPVARLSEEERQMHDGRARRQRRRLRSLLLLRLYRRRRETRRLTTSAVL